MPGNPYAAFVLRAARREADLSQRQLAAGSCVPTTTISAIEACRRDPALSVFARLLVSCGWTLCAVDSTGRVLHEVTEHDSWRDAGGRRYPAHLDVRETGPRGDWWGDSYLGARGVPERPALTFDLDRDRRDRRRRR